MPEVRVVTGYGRCFNYRIFQDVVTIGRSKDNDIVLSDHTASRKHAKLRKTPDGYLLIDLYSHNGTCVDGARITSRILKHNDLVEIGTSVLTFQNVIEDGEESLGPKDTCSPLASDRKEGLLPLAIAVREEDDPLELIASIKSLGPVQDEDLLAEIEGEDKETSQISLINVERSNKILYVLYQTTRTLLKTTDMDDLLKTIMDLLFQVIDVDFGFAVLAGSGFGGIIPKVLKHKRIPERPLQELTVNRTILDRVINQRLSLLCLKTLSSSEAEERRTGDSRKVHTYMSVPLWRKNEVIGMIQLESHHTYNAFMKPDLDLLTTITNQMAIVIEQANLMEKVRREEMKRNRLERFHSPEIVDLIIREDSEDEGTMLAPKEKTATVLFTDIVNFTPLSERLSPTEVSHLLNQFFTEMNEIIFSYQGTLDKYIGDAIMAIFGAPIERENDAERAIRAAIEMRNALLRMNQRLEPDKIFDIRLGINTGRVVAGNLGSPKRMDYTVIGDVVNTASRLEKIAQPNQILIGEATFSSVKGKFDIKKVGKKNIKGKSEAVMVYEVCN